MGGSFGKILTDPTYHRTTFSSTERRWDFQTEPLSQIRALVHIPPGKILIQALLLIPPNDAASIHDAIPGSITDGQGNFAFPCSTTAQLEVSFAGTKFSISAKDYVGTEITGGGRVPNNMCQSNIVGQQIGGPDQWLMGDVFLKNVNPGSGERKLIWGRFILSSILTTIKLGLERSLRADHLPIVQMLNYSWQNLGLENHQ